MKYKIQLKLLRGLVYTKRAVWWLGSRLGLVLGVVFSSVLKIVAYFEYKIKLVVNKLGLSGYKEWLVRRGVLQILLIIILLLISWSQTKAGLKDLLQGSQTTLAYRLLGSEEEYISEEELAGPGQEAAAVPVWSQGAVAGNVFAGQGERVSSNVYTGLVAGGGAVQKPIIINGFLGGNVVRVGVLEYTVEPGDSLGSIAEDFNVNVSTILWENNLTLRSIIRPGDTLRILPINGIGHTVKKGDNVKKIASRYGGKPEEIIAFNHLKENGSDLRAGEKIIIPNGVKPREVVVARVNYARQISVALPPPSRAAPSASGFIWPTAARSITQYFGWRHNGLDISGHWQTPVYAAKAGIVSIARCGWNGGYGCYVVVDHGNGLSTLYGHNSRNLVSPGEAVETGQTIALMGNSGNVRGLTGIHVHFEVRINGVRVNPLRYVK